jgi:hypothetical protein
MLLTKWVISPGGLLPQLGTGSLVVRERVVGVGELVEDDPAAFIAHAFGNVARQFHAAILRRQHQLGAKGLHGLPALDALVLGHDQDHPVAARGSDHRQRNAGIAGGGFDQRVSRADLAALLGARDHRQRRAILDRPGRVVALELAENAVAARFASRPRQALQAHQRRAADIIIKGLIHDFRAISDIAGCPSRHRQTALRNPPCAASRGRPR